MAIEKKIHIPFLKPYYQHFTIHIFPTYMGPMGQSWNAPICKGCPYDGPFGRLADKMGQGPKGPSYGQPFAYGGNSWFKCEHVFLYCKLGTNCNACHKKWIGKNAIIILVVLAFLCWTLIYFEIFITAIILIIFSQCNTFNGPFATWNHEKFVHDKFGLQIFQDYWLKITTDFHKFQC
jgi:hypothetical protein